MHFKSISRLALGVICVSLIAGCSNKAPKKVHHKPVGHYQHDESMTHGLGESTEFIEKDHRQASNEGSQKADNKNTYLFAFDRFQVADHDLTSVHAHADYLLKHPETKIYIYGHTDQRGSRGYNVALGERRAQAVKQLLRSRGVSADQIKIVSYGSEKPAAVGNNEDAYRQNRRAQTVYE